MMNNFEIKNIDCHASLAVVTENAQSARSLLPESGADAPAVFSTVYTDSTSAKNRQADVPQHGRSMIQINLLNLMINTFLIIFSQKQHPC